MLSVRVKKKGAGCKLTLIPILKKKNRKNVLFSLNRYLIIITIYFSGN